MFTSCIFLSLFILFSLLWFGSPFCRLKGYGSTLLWNQIFVWDWTTKWSRINAYWILCLWCVRRSWVTSLWSAMNCPVICSVISLGLVWLQDVPFIIFIFVFLLCWRIGLGCLALKLLASAWAWFPYRRGNFWICFSSYLPWCQEFNSYLKIWNWLRGLWVWILSYSSIKNFVSTEQKIKPNFDGEAILHSWKQSKGFTKIYRAGQREEEDSF